MTSVCVDPSGRLLVSGHEDASCLLYDVVGGRVIQTFRPHGDEVRTVRFSNAAYYLLSGSYDKRYNLRSVRSSQWFQSCDHRHARGPHRSADVSAGGRAQRQGYSVQVSAMAFAQTLVNGFHCRWHPQDFTFLSTSADRTAVLWSLPVPPSVD